MPPKLRRLLLRVLISAVLLVVLIRSIDLHEAGAALAGAHAGSLGAAFALITSARILMALKWRLLISAHGETIRKTDALSIYYRAAFLGLVLPATVGADAVRLALTRSLGIPGRRVLSSIAIERSIGLGVTLILSGIGAALAWTVGPLEQAFPAQARVIELAVAGGLLAGLLSWLMVRSPAARRRIGKLLPQWANRETVRDMRDRALTLLQTRRRALILFTALTVTEALLAISAAWVVTRAFGIDLNPALILTVLPMHFLLIRIPVSLAGLGLHEVSFAYFLTALGVDAATAVAAGATHHLLLILAVLPGCLTGANVPASASTLCPDEPS